MSEAKSEVECDDLVFDSTKLLRPIQRERKKGRERERDGVESKTTATAAAAAAAESAIC